MNDLLKRLGIGVLIGLAVAIIVGVGTQKISFLKEVLDGYEYRSYDSRMKSRVDEVEESSIDSVVSLILSRILLRVLEIIMIGPTPTMVNSLM